MRVDVRRTAPYAARGDLAVRKLTATLFLLVFSLSAAISVTAQSVTLPLYDNGTFIRAGALLGNPEAYGGQIGAGYSISGVLDLGLRFGAGVEPGDSAVTSDIGMSYSFAALKQSDAIPLAAQLYGAYTFRAEQSDFLTRNRLLQEARGYSLGVALVRDLYLGSAFAFRLSALAEYSNYTQTTTVGFDSTGFTGSADVDYDEYPIVERISGFLYGGYGGFFVRAGQRMGIQAGAAVLVDPYLNLEVRPDLQILLTR